MAQDSWPSPAHNSRNVTDAEYEKIASHFSGDGVWGIPADPAVVTAGTGLQVLVKAGKRASVRGHAWYAGAADDPLSIASNASGSTRIDRVVLRLDRATWTVRAVVKTGTPGAGAPVLTQDTGDSGTYEVQLAQVTVPDAAASVTVQRGELYIGSRVRPVLSGQSNVAPVPGEIEFQTDTGIGRIWNGSAWRVFFGDSGVVNVNGSAAPWTVNTDYVLEKRNGVVHFRLGSSERTGGTLSSGTESRLPVSIPSAYRHPTRDQYATVYVEGVEVGRITIYPANHSRAGEAWLTQHPTISNGQFVLGASISWVVD